MVHVAAVGSEVEPPRETTLNESVQKVSDAGAVFQAGESHVVAAQTESAVQSDRDQELSLAVAEAERFEGADAFAERHSQPLQMFRIVWRAAAAAVASTPARGGASISDEPGLGLSSELAARVVFRDEFDIAMLEPAMLGLVLDPQVGQFKMAPDD